MLIKIIFFFLVCTIEKSVGSSDFYPVLSLGVCDPHLPVPGASSEPLSGVKPSSSAWAMPPHTGSSAEALARHCGPRPEKHDCSLAGRPAVPTSSHGSPYLVHVQGGGAGTSHPRPPPPCRWHQREPVSREG